MVEMRGGITGVGNNGPVNASLCVSVSKEAFMGGRVPPLRQVISTFPGAERGERTTPRPCPQLQGPGGGIGPAVR